MEWIRDVSIPSSHKKMMFNFHFLWMLHCTENFFSVFWQLTNICKMSSSVSTKKMTLKNRFGLKNIFYFLSTAHSSSVWLQKHGYTVTGMAQQIVYLRIKLFFFVFFAFIFVLFVCLVFFAISGSKIEYFAKLVLRTKLFFNYYFKNS